MKPYAISSTCKSNRANRQPSSPASHALSLSERWDRRQPRQWLRQAPRHARKRRHNACPTLREPSNASRNGSKGICNIRLAPPRRKPRSRCVRVRRLAATILVLAARARSIRSATAQMSEEGSNALPRSRVREKRKTDNFGGDHPAMPPGTMPGQMPERHAIPGIKNLVAVASGKGGVGKTTVAVNVALALAKLGYKVGLLDADVYGPNVPIMLGSTAEPTATAQQRIIPVVAQGVKMISMGLLNPGDKPVIWRGPMLHSVITQFLRSVEWGELDYLIIDLPPGTGDVQLTLIQTVAVTGAVVVTTPSAVALADVRKAIEMFRQVSVEVLGVVENMSTFACPHCGKPVDIFGHGEGAKTAIEYGVPVLGEIEIDPRIRLGGDTGMPVTAQGETAPAAQSLYRVARAVSARLEEVAATAGGPKVQID